MGILPPCVCLCTMSMPAKAQRECQVLWNWRYKQVCGYWEWNLDSLEEQLVLLTAETSLLIMFLFL